ncbi:hypothetical protein A9Q99_14985 [Gammaproteobacteria bacterium 45_16_T64]|nr:hypothetical protein A9Q99_14985 [Gammaproteobacteria bacterium 45_16_T64]
MKTLALGFLLILILTSIVLTRTLLVSRHVHELPEPPVKPAALVSQASTQKIIHRFSQAIQFPTVSTWSDSDFKGEPFQQLHRHIDRSFPAIANALNKEIINQHSIVYTWQGSDPTLKPLLLLNHLDVVPVAPNNIKQWHYPPFSGAIADGYVWGRGTLDDKNGVMALLEAVEILINAGFKPTRSIYIALGHDEEIGGVQGAMAMAKHFKSQGIQFEYLLDEGGTIIKDDILPDVTDPVAMVGISQKGYTTLRLSLTGESGHSSVPPRHTVIGELSQIITQLENSPMEIDLSFSSVVLEKITPLTSFNKKLLFSNLWLFRPLVSKVMADNPLTNASIRTTMAVTMINGGIKDNVLPDYAEAIVNFRTMPGVTDQDLIQYIHQAAQHDGLTIDIVTTKPSSGISSATATGFKAIEKTLLEIKQDPHLVISPFLFMAATDATHYEDISDNQYRFLAVTINAADKDRFHGLNERIAIDEYLNIIWFYHQLIKNSQ